MAAKKVSSTAPPEGAVVDPTPDAPVPAETPLAPGAPKRVRITRNGNAEAGGGHYTLRVGAIMVLDQRVADDLIAQKMAEEV